MNKAIIGVFVGIVVGMVLVEACPELKKKLDEAKQKLMKKKES